MHERKSFIIHKDSLRVLDELTDEEAGRLFKAIKAYQCGETLTADTLTKIALSPFISQFEKDAIKSRCGCYHWNWKGGVSTENQRQRNSSEYKQWRTNVFNRDNFTCQHCGAYGVELNAHHIKLWSTHPELRFEVSNGLTLCKECHIEVHRER